MFRKNDKNPFVKKWVSRVWDFSNGHRPLEIVTDAWSSDTVGHDTNFSWRIGQQGKEIYCDTADFNNNIILDTYSEVSKYHGGFTVRFRVDSLAATNGIVRYNSAYSITVATDGTLEYTNSGVKISTASGAISANRWHTVTLMLRAPSGADEARMWLDGQYVGVDTVGVVGATGTTYLFRDGAVSGMKGSIAFFCEHYGHEIVGDRVFPATDKIARFHANPWQVFAPQRFFVPMTAAAVVEEFGPETSVIIVDVNTTESWADGDKNLPITGLRFV